MSLVLSILCVIAMAFGAPSEQFAAEHCPSAASTCEKSKNENEYKCVAFANQPSKEEIPQYSWQVSAGKIVGDPKGYRIVINAHQVEATSVVVTVKVKWPKSPRRCEATVVNTISLRPQESKKTLNVHGVEYANACTPDGRKALRKSVWKVAGRRDANGAWRLVETLLCAPDSKASRRYLTSVVPAKVRSVSSGTGQDDVSESVRRDAKLFDALLAEGDAWRATVESVSKQVSLSYYPNEACINTRTLSFVSKRWRLVKISDACD
jgi:hypothetical protein